MPDIIIKYDQTDKNRDEVQLTVTVKPYDIDYLKLAW